MSESDQVILILIKLRMCPQSGELAARLIASETGSTYEIINTMIDFTKAEVMKLDFVAQTIRKLKTARLLV